MRRAARSSAPIVAALGVLLGAALVAGEVGPATVLVEDWSEQPLGRQGIPIGWEGQSWGRAAYDFRVEERRDDGRLSKVLRMTSDGDNSTIARRIPKIDVKQLPILEWQWRAVALPAGGDLAGRPPTIRERRSTWCSRGSRPRCGRA